MLLAGVKRVEQILKRSRLTIEQNERLKSYCNQNLPTPKELKAHSLGQASIFNQSTITSGHYNWTRTKTDLIELIQALLLTNCITTRNGKVKRRELISLLGWFFDIRFGNIESTLNQIKERKRLEFRLLNDLNEAMERWSQS